MARIAFFTERLPPDPDAVARFSFELMRSLAEQQHEIRIFSTYRPGDALPAPIPRIEVLRPFRNWSALEMPRLVPLLIEFRPDLMHVIQPRGVSISSWFSALGAINLLAALAPLLGRPPFLLSLYDFAAQDLKRLGSLIARCDGITVSNEAQRLLLETHFRAMAKRPLVQVVPISTGPSADEAGDDQPLGSESNSQTAALDVLLNSSARILFVPGQLHQQGDLDTLFTEMALTLAEFPDLAIVFGGDWGAIPLRRRHQLMRRVENVGGRILLTGALTADLEKRCMGQAHLVFAAALPEESLDLARLLRLALEVSTPIVMSRAQAATDPLRWRHEENVLIAETNEWQTVLRRALTSPGLLEQIRRQLPEFSREEAVDQPANVMSRVYSRLLDHRRSGSHRNSVAADGSGH